jgi:hypothetical protein
MTPKKTLQQRERELQLLLATPEGRKELEEVESRYHAAGCRPRPARASVITHILVYEREIGLLVS